MNKENYIPEDLLENKPLSEYQELKEKIHNEMTFCTTKNEARAKALHEAFNAYSRKEITPEELVKIMGAIYK